MCELWGENYMLVHVHLLPCMCEERLAKVCL